MMSQYIILAGILLILLGFLVVFAGIMINALSGESATKSDVRGGGIIFIGPIPIIFGSDRSTVITVMVLAVVMMLVFYFLFRR